MPHKYNFNWPDEAGALDIELICFRDNHLPENGGLGSYRHLKKAINLIWKKVLWNDWLEWALKTLCENRVVAFTGCGSAGKTYAAGMFAFLFWLCAPTKTSVIFTSTTGKMVRKRIWPVIQELYHNLPAVFGNLVDSKTTLQTTKGDDKHGVFALAVREGPTSKAVADIQGLHAERILIVIDEGTDTPEAILEAIANLRKGCSDFRILIIGNAASHLDPHGILCEPKDGWNSISVEDEEWETKGSPRWEIEPGVCLHFDGLKSPNIKVGQDKFPFLFTNADLNRSQNRSGARESIGFWKYTRGFWAPEGVCKTVLSEAMVEKHEGRGNFIFQFKSYKIAGLDPGFGGDDCVLRVARVGDLEDGRMGIQLWKRFVIPVKAISKEPVHYQIVSQVQAICESEGVWPQHFGLDASGEGGGLASIFMREWSDKIHWVEFGGLPTDLPASEEDRRPAKEVYDRKVTELWFSVREFLVNGQLRGLTDTDVIQFSSREFSDEKRKIVLDTKADCKKKIGHSPDDADAVAVAIEVARRIGIEPGGGGRINPHRDYLAIARKYDSINVNDEDELVPSGVDDRFAMSDF